MPRKRKAARSFCQKPSTTVAAMRKRFDTPWSLLWLRLAENANFFKDLPTAAERSGFTEAFPAEFYGMFDFFTCESDAYPASVHHEFQVFRRPADEFLAMISERNPAPFDAPDLRAIHFYPERIEAAAVARGRWWRANNLPMTAAERKWLSDRV